VVVQREEDPVVEIGEARVDVGERNELRLSAMNSLSAETIGCGNFWSRANSRRAGVYEQGTLERLRDEWRPADPAVVAALLKPTGRIPASADGAGDRRRPG